MSEDTSTRDADGPSTKVDVVPERDYGEVVVDIHDLRKVYGKGRTATHALKGVDLEIRQGEFLAVIGTSGSGKTTMLNVLGGLDRGFEGSVSIAGHRIRKLSDRRLSKFRNETIGFVFQAFNLLPHMTCAENVMLPSFFGGKSGERGRARAVELLERVGLGDKIDDKPTELSGGQRQRVSIARALFNEPKLILCDEPTGSLDSGTGKQILALFREINAEQGLTFVLVTHDEKVSLCCDRIVRLEDGLKVSDGYHAALAPSELKTWGPGDASDGGSPS